MNFPKLGRLLTLKAQEVWGNEPKVFTPWLSENLDLLAEAIGFEELELKDTEVAAGDFRIDILAEDERGVPVVIENQFGPTDHRHLGQLISYVASQSGKAAVVWVAERIKEDHRAAIDWLNSSTTDDYSFFAVEVEALKIGDSDPAPYFNVVAKPNVWARSVSAVVRESATEEAAERHRLRMKYWASFAEFLRQTGSTFKIRRPNKDHWFSFAIGRGGVVISATISVERYNRIGVELYFHRDPLKLAFNQLHAEKDDIEREFGEPLEWQELPGKKASRIACYKYDVDPAESSQFSDLHVWMLDHMERFKRVFQDRVKNLAMDQPPVADDEFDHA